MSGESDADNKEGQYGMSEIGRDDMERLWREEESSAHMKGWDFSHIGARYREEDDLPWDYGMIVRGLLKPDDHLLDVDTGGGEFLLSLGHPYHLTAATEAYPPNVELCRATFEPLGIAFAAVDGADPMPFADGEFDMVINRHGDFNARELHRVLKPGGVFVTEQVGAHNDRELVELLLPGTPEQYPDLTLANTVAEFEAAGFAIDRAEEAFRPIEFYDVGALVWFAHIIEWEFPGFSVDRCLPQLHEAQRILDRDGAIRGTIHRFLIVARNGA